MDHIEDIIMRYSQRGMTKLRPHMEKNYCCLAAEEIRSWKRGVVFLTTGFYVAGFPETDGPTGTAVLASVLRDMGFRPVIVTEPENAELFIVVTLASRLTLLSFVQERNAQLPTVVTPSRTA